MPSATTIPDDRIDVLIGVRQIAAALGLPPRAVQHLIRSGRLPTGRLGTRVVASRRLLQQAVNGALAGVSLPDGDV
jgi:hypothetical protein